MFIRISEDLLIDPTRVVAIEVQQEDGKILIIARHAGGALTTLHTEWVGWRSNGVSYPDLAKQYDEWYPGRLAEMRTLAETFATMITEGRG